MWIHLIFEDASDLRFIIKISCKMLYRDSHLNCACQFEKQEHLIILMPSFVIRKFKMSLLCINFTEIMAREVCDNLLI